MPASIFETEFEYLILALIGEGLSSGNAIRRALTKTRGGRWSTESGSVYRVIKKLHKDALIQEVAVRGRLRPEYKLTGNGEAVLLSWLMLAPGFEEFAFLVDTIRTRCYFLDRLSQESRIKAVKGWLENSAIFCSSLERQMEDAAFPNSIRRMAYENLFQLARARHAWLKHLLHVVTSDAAVGPQRATETVIATL